MSEQSEERAYGQPAKPSRDWRAVRLEFLDGPDRPPIFVDQSFRSLPLYSLEGRAVDDIPQFTSGSIRICLRDPDYGCKVNGDPARIVKEAATAPEGGIKIATSWLNHAHLFSYFIQFEYDASREKVRDLCRHTEIVSLISDCLLAIDTSILWKTFDGLLKIEQAYQEHRADPERDRNYERHRSVLEKAHQEYESVQVETRRLIQRIERTLEAWTTLRTIESAADGGPDIRSSKHGVSAFLSYSHQDEHFRAELEKHLAPLRRDGSITTWSDKCIVPGQEWEKEIVEALERSQLVLLLISPDFLASDFCVCREFERALQRHQAGESVVVPIIVRHCDWKSTSIVQFQALPTGARPIKSWNDMDEAFADVVQGLRRVLGHLAR